MNAARPAGLDAFFHPRAVAVLGASRTPGKAGYQQLVNLLRGYRGQIFPINPNPGEILGLATHRSIADVPAEVDLAIVLLQAAAVPAAVRDCVQAKVDGVLIASAGFAETGAAGRALQDEMTAAIRGSATRIWGPNCNGLVNTGNSLFASFVDLPAVRAGKVAIVSQTGIFAAAFLNQLMDVPTFGVSKVATLGNICDVSEIDLLEYLAHDAATEVIALYLEGFRDGRRLFDICRELTRRKPVIALVAGRTAAGARASMSHTANLAADARIARAALLEAGVVLADEFTHLAQLAHAFACTPRVVPSSRIAVLTTTGGAGVVAADQIAAKGLDIATLDDSTVRRLNAFHPLPPGGANPLDIWPAMQTRGTNATIGESLSIALDDPGVDAALLIMGAFSGGGTDFDPAGLRGVLARCEKPVFGWLYGPATHVDAWEATLAHEGVPVYRDLRSVADALAAIDGLYRYRQEPLPAPRGSNREALQASQKLVASARAAATTTLTEPEAYRLLAAWGVPAARWAMAADEHEAADAAREIGFPVALKVVSRQILHKTDVGGVALGLVDEAAVRAAVQSLGRAIGVRAPHAHVEGWLVQQMVAAPFEAIVGMVDSPQFGPAVMLGAGGTYVEALGRVEFLLPPFGALQVDRIIERTGLAQMLAAGRGAPETPRDGLRAVMLAFGDIAASGLPIAQVEVNPLRIARDGRVAAVDALVILG